MPQNHEPKPVYSSEVRVDMLLGGTYLDGTVSGNTITADEAPLIRAALIRAQALRSLQTDPGDAYIQGLTDALEYMHLAQSVQNSLNELETAAHSELPPAA